MEKMITKPGLEPILEKIFKYLDSSNVFICLSVCKYWNQVVKSPTFLLKQLKLAKMPEDLLQKWKQLAIKLQENVELNQDFSQCLLWALKTIKSCGFFTPESAASALGLLPLLKFVASYRPISYMNKYYDRWFPNLTVIHLSSKNGHHETLTYLLKLRYSDAKMYCNLKDINGTKPIHMAAQNGHLECVKILINHGSRIDYEGFDGKTPFQLAVQYGHLEIFQYLMSAICI